MINLNEALEVINDVAKKATIEMNKKKAKVMKEYIIKNIDRINVMAKVLKSIDDNNFVRKRFEEFNNDNEKYTYHIYTTRWTHQLGLMEYNKEFSLGICAGGCFGSYDLYIKPDGKIIFILKDNSDITYDIEELATLDKFDILILELAYEGIDKLEKQINEFIEYLKK